MDNQGTTNNNNEITEEGMNLGTTSGNDEGTTSNNNEITEKDDITVFVAFNGKWELDDKEWLFKDSKGSIMAVSKYVTLPQITNILCAKFNVDQDSYGLKLEVYYRVGFPIIEIECDEDLSLFISESTKTKLLLCVTTVEEFPSLYFKEESRRRKGDTSEDCEDRLLKAIQKGDWEKAREIVNTKEVTWTSKLDDDGYTALHCAVGAYYKDNEVVRYILMGINKELLVTTVDIQGLNPVHFAAAHGNIEALKIMLDFNPKCLIISDNNDLLPIHYSLGRVTFLYLLEKMRRYIFECDILFRGMSGLKLLNQVIDTGLIDVAYELINKYPSLATTVYGDKTALECIIRRPALFYSGTHDYNIYSRFVYHMIPIENHSFGSTDTADMENQETPKKDTFVAKNMRWRLHDGMLYMNYAIPKL